MQTGRIIQLLAGFYDVLTPEGQVIRTRARGAFRKQNITPLVGDMVEYKVNEDESGYIVGIKPRKNDLIRPPLANIDQAVVVTSVTQPDFSANLLDRQLVALEQKNIKAVLYFSKTDLLDETTFDDLKDIVAYYSRIGYQVFYPESFKAENDVSKLVADFDSKLTIFMGQTGAGKSTLLNKIDPKLNIETGEVSKALNRGKHTTRKVSLIELANGLVADTPGFSTFTAFETLEKELKDTFIEFRAIADECRFRECMHVNEPGCAVKNAVNNNEILESRYENYLQFLKLIQQQKPDYTKKNYVKKDRRKKK